MGTVNVPNTSVVYSNPKQIDQTTNIDPLTGKVWKPSGTDSYNFTYPNGVTGIGIGNVSTGSAGVGINLGDPQPGTFDPTPPKANPVIVNADPPVPGKGQPITVQGATGSTGVPTTDVNRQVSGTVPNSSVTIRNPA
jgi:hypothetical protein